SMPFIDHPGTLSPTFFPIMLGAILFVLSLRIVAEPFLRKNGETTEKTETENKSMIMAVLFSTIAYVVLLEYAGFLMSTALFLIVVMRLLKAGTFLKSLVISLLITFSIQAVFTYLFEVVLPIGFWFGG
ncbi:MAG TPA: tripartite tricarboxylate transporter TctB family protein, partial [Clostridia bacterium]|nr:tripartite tricarboxylate transporter TctB family protein [Clostridia bacterium]